MDSHTPKAQLLRELKSLRMIFDRVPARIWYKNADNIILKLNKTAADSMGLTFEQGEGADTYDLYPEHAKQYHEDDLRVLNSGEAMIGYLEPHRPLNGPHGWVRTDKIPFFDPITQERSLLVMSMDVTEEVELKHNLEIQQKKLETTLEKLSQSETRFRLVAEGSSVGIWDVSLSDDQSVFYSPTFEALLGYKDGELPSQYDESLKLIHPDDFDRYEAEFETCLTSQTPFKMEIRMRHKKLGYRWYLASGLGQWKADGTPIRMLGSTMDIHDEKMAKLDADAHLADLKEANSDLESFAYIASHDLKTPLRNIANLTNWIEEDIGIELSDDIQKKFDLLKGRITSMETMLGDILAFSQAGKQTKPTKTVNLETVIKDVLDLAAPPKAFKIEKKRSFPELLTSKTAVEQIFLNLISNAIKHHDLNVGEIILDYIEHQDHYEFIVKDDGPGIENDYRDYVFEVFKRLKTRDEVEGSGIGLAIVKKMVKSIGGRIWLAPQSEERGATFHFTIPKAPG